MHMFGDVADHSGGRLLDDHDATARLIFAESDGEVVGTVRLNWGGDAPFSDEHRVTYGLDPFLGVVERSRLLVATRMIVRATHRGSPLPLALWRACAEFGRAHDIMLAFCNYQPHLISFYQLAGFKPYTVAYNDPHFGIMIPLRARRPGHRVSRTGTIAPRRRSSWLGRNLSKLDSVKALLPDAPPVRSALPSVDGLATQLRTLLGSHARTAASAFSRTSTKRSSAGCSNAVTSSSAREATSSSGVAKSSARSSSCSKASWKRSGTA